jgi:hypothetical protein
MSSLVKVPPYSKWNFQEGKFSFQTGVILLKVGPMIADQEKINGCVRFAFQLSPFLKPGGQK